VQQVEPQVIQEDVATEDMVPVDADAKKSGDCQPKGVKRLLIQGQIKLVIILILS